MLILHVYMAEYMVHGEAVAGFRGTTTKEQGMKILKMYVQSLGPLSKLRENGLGRFFAHLAWPLAHNRSVLRNPSSAREKTTYLRQRIEQLIMGDDYHSTLLETREPGNSQWLEECLADHMSG